MFILKSAHFVRIWPDCKGCGVQEQCGTTIDCDAACGYIISPGFPNPLTPLYDTNCRWWIRASLNQVVEVEFLDFDVNYLAEDDSGLVADPHCLQTFISLFTVVIEKQPPIRHIIGRFCNDNKPPESAIVSTSSVMELQYSLKTVSEGKLTRGFLAKYRLKNLDAVSLDAGNTTQGTSVVEY